MFNVFLVLLLSASLSFASDEDGVPPAKPNTFELHVDFPDGSPTMSFLAPVERGPLLIDIVNFFVDLRMLARQQMQSGTFWMNPEQLAKTHEHLRKASHWLASGRSVRYVLMQNELADHFDDNTRYSFIILRHLLPGEEREALQAAFPHLLQALFQLNPGLKREFICTRFEFVHNSNFDAFQRELKISQWQLLGHQLQSKSRFVIGQILRHVWKAQYDDNVMAFALQDLMLELHASALPVCHSVFTEAKR